MTEEGPIISGTPRALAFVQAHREELYRVADRVSETKVDAHTGYPELVEAHAGFHERLPALYTEAVMDPEFDPRTSLRRMQEFFGMSDAAMPFSAASDALASALDVFTKPGDGVMVVTPTWDIYPKLIVDAGDGGREVVQVDLRSPEGFLEDLRRAEAQGVKVSTIIINTPRNPDMHTIDSEDLEQIVSIADEHGITVISDEVFGFYDPNMNIEETHDEAGVRTGNRFVNEMPRARSSVVIRDTGKILPSPPFPKVALLDMSEGALEQGGKRLAERQADRHFVDPNIDLHILERILHDEALPQMIEDINVLSDKNFDVLKAQLAAEFGMRHCGPFALVPIGEWGLPSDYIVKYLHDLGLDARNSFDYKTRERYSFVRIPLVKPEDKFEALAAQLGEKIEGVKTYMQLKGLLFAAKQAVYLPAMVEVPSTDKPSPTSEQDAVE
jgi:hypothetical protein